MGTRMKLADFYRYARENRKRIGDIYREIEEIQYQFNELYTRQQDERNKQIAALAPRFVSEESAGLPPELQRLFESQVEAERKALQEEMIKLESEIAEKRQKTDGLIQEAQSEVAEVREQNPILDQQEEELKARRASMEREIEKLDKELQGTNLLSGFLARRRLRQEREQLVDNVQEVTQGIRKVREAWQAKKARLQEAQTSLQTQWQALSVEVSQLQARLDYLTNNFDTESKRNAAWNLLSSLDEVPVTQGDWRDQLSPLVELTHSKTQYETSLRSVAEILGMLKGLGEGMDRFIRSVGTVYEEQRRYKLPSLTVNLADTVTAFHAIWPDFQARVKDEKYLGTHPVEFEQRISAIVPQRLGEAPIQKMFDDMGKALTQATKAWR
jgi:predicted  nucleic acid-binding Zn-ribbon protein